MIFVLFVILAGLFIGVTTFAVAREMRVTRWAALTAAGGTLVAAVALGMTILTYLHPSLL